VRYIFGILGPTVALLLVSLQVAAHHSGSMYDDERSIKFQGTVVKFKWANPHVYIEIETKNDTGENVTWFIEGLAPTGMVANGWTRMSLVPGEEITVTGSPARIPNLRKALGHSFIKADGTLLEIRTTRSGDGPPPVDLPVPLVAPDLSGRWATRWNPQVVAGFMQPQKSWSLTEKGLAAMESYNRSLDPAINCVPEPSPYVMIWPSGKNLEIAEDIIIIRDELGVVRSVNMKVDSHDGAVYSDQGHSIGMWEDDVLVVDTTHFADHRRGLAFAGLASGKQKHLIERFELSPDHTTMQYSYWLEDPEYLAEPTTGKLELVYRPDRPFVSEPCDLDNARRHLDE